MQARDDDKIKQLILQHAKGELNEAGEAELSRWRAENAEHEAMFRRVVSMRNLETGYRRFVKSQGAENRSWERILARTTRRKREGRRLTWMRYAATILLPLLVAGGIYVWLERADEEKQVATVTRIAPGKARAELVLPGGNTVVLGQGATPDLRDGVSNSGDTLNYAGAVQQTAVGEEELHVLRVPRGGEYTLVLADGTTVYLNAGSELSYPVRFSGEKRKVYLKGEGYFDVKRDERLPFVVEAGEVEVLVLGTSFGVRAYGEEERVLTTLVHGKVRVSAEGQRVELVPGQQAGYSKGDERLSVDEVDTEQYVGWKDGRLIFDNKPLSVILAELGRWYSFDVVYGDEKLKDIPYSLNIKKHEDIAHVLKFIERTGKVKFNINKNMIVVQ